MNKDIRICFHGTSKENAEKILVEGFNVGTFFADHLEDALAFGGEYVFFVRFEESGFNIDSVIEWQFHLRDRVLPDKIWKLIRYSKEVMSEND